MSRMGRECHSEGPFDRLGFTNQTAHLAGVGVDAHIEVAVACSVSGSCENTVGCYTAFIPHLVRNLHFLHLTALDY
jgi:hypothetical protein